MILGLGLDLCPVDRIEAIIERHGEQFLDRVFTRAEQAYAGSGPTRGERLAARFAVKEATIKALGAPEGMRWRDMEVTKRPDGAPMLALHGDARRAAEARGVVETHVSLTHAGNMAVAVVILEGAQAPCGTNISS